MRMLEPDTLYGIEELRGSERDRALGDVRDCRERDLVDISITDMIKSVKAFVNIIGFDIRNYAIYLYEPVRFNLVDTLGDDRNVEDMVDKINSDWSDEVDGACSLTGNYTDCYIYDHFRNIGGTSESSFLTDVEDAVNYAFTTFLNELEESLDNEDHSIEYAIDRNLEFYDDGELYTG